MRTIRRSEWVIWEPIIDQLITHSDLRLVLISPIQFYEWSSYHPFSSTNGPHIAHYVLRMVLIAPIMFYEWFSYRRPFLCPMNGPHITHYVLRMILLSPIMFYEWFSYRPLCSANGHPTTHYDWKSQLITNRNKMGDMRTIHRSELAVSWPFVDQNGRYEDHS
jgi:hypothetical protein